MCIVLKIENLFAFVLSCTSSLHRIVFYLNDVKRNNNKSENPKRKQMVNTITIKIKIFIGN